MPCWTMRRPSSGAPGRAPDRRRGRVTQPGGVRRNGVMRTCSGRATSACPSTPTHREVLGRRCFATLEEAAEATGAVRHRRCLPAAEHTPRSPGPPWPSARALWLQLGIVAWEAARIAHEGGLDGRHGPLHRDRAAAHPLGRAPWRGAVPADPTISAHHGRMSQASGIHYDAQPDGYRPGVCNIGHGRRSPDAGGWGTSAPSRRSCCSGCSWSSTCRPSSVSCLPFQRPSPHRGTSRRACASAPGSRPPGSTTSGMSGRVEQVADRAALAADRREGPSDLRRQHGDRTGRGHHRGAAAGLRLAAAPLWIVSPWS